MLQQENEALMQEDNDDFRTAPVFRQPQLMHPQFVEVPLLKTKGYQRF